MEDIRPSTALNGRRSTISSQERLENPWLERTFKPQRSGRQPRAFLLPFKNEDVRITLADHAHGPGQRLEVGRKLSPLRPRDLAIDLVNDRLDK
jgi:hypothetical protein